MPLFEDLEARGLVHQLTDPKLADSLNKGKMVVYLGFDPTSDSLHVGSLLGLVTLRRLQLAGHTVFPLVGGATGAIGDPSGKTQERQFLDSDQIEKNAQGISKVISRFIDLNTPGARLLNNFDWLK